MRWICAVMMSLALMVVGLSAIAAFAGTGQVAKALMMTVFGLMLSTVGTDRATGVERFTFGSIDLLDGISFLLLAMATFAPGFVGRPKDAGDAATALGEPRCWGINNNGQVGDGSMTNAVTPQAVSMLEMAEVADAGVEHSCAISGGSAFCWGRSLLDGSYSEFDGWRSWAMAVVDENGAIVVQAGIGSGRQVNDVDQPRRRGLRDSSGEPRAICQRQVIRIRCPGLGPAPGQGLGSNPLGLLGRDPAR